VLQDRLGTLISINVGMPISVMNGKKEVMTGIFKSPVQGPVAVQFTGLSGDGQADLINHGGPDKAICVYTTAHQTYWSERWGRPVEIGAFGENFTITDGLETNVCIGDIIQAGDAVVQVSQARLPCFKLGIRNRLPALPGEVQQTGYTGYYFRVLQEGKIAAGDELTFISRHPARMTVKEAAAIMLFRKDELADALRLQAITGLAASWKETLADRIERLSGQSGGEQG